MTTFGNHRRTIEIGNRTRSYLIHIPPSYDETKPTSVVLVFHGSGSNAEQMVRFCGLDDKADQAGFITIYPNGSGQADKFLTWNGGSCCGYAAENNIDDIGFIQSLLDDLEQVVALDRRRIYATGMSNGALMAYRLASELSERIAAIAPVAGPMGTETCQPRRPVPVLHFHGIEDEFAPYGGGKGAKSITQTNFYSVEHTIRAWVKANGCKEEPVIITEPDRAQDGTSITHKIYVGGKDGAEVVLIVIEGGGHTWPGQEPMWRFLGKSTKNISANDVIWNFFQKHPMREEPANAI
jgi:polyhydroxybutyrate depolymerase